MLTVVWNNLNYQTVRHAYHNYSGRMARSGHYAGMYLGDPDINFVKLAESLGCVGMRVEQPSEVQPALKQALSLNRPVVLDVRTDSKAMAPRGWTGAAEAPLRPGTGY